MRVRVVCPEHSAYEGEASFVALPSTDGELGVLPNHASEICTVKSGYVRICDQTMGEVSHRFAVSGGYAEITADEVIVLAQRAHNMDDVNAEEVQAQLKGFEDALCKLSEDDARRSYLYNEIAWCKLLLAS